MAALAAVSAAIWAAKGVDFLEPRKPKPPEEAQDRALPLKSVMVTMVLLKEERICAAPFSTFLRSLRRLITFFAFTLAMSYPSFTSSYWQWSSSDPSGSGHWSWSAVRAPAGRGGGVRPDSSRFPCAA